MRRTQPRKVKSLVRPALGPLEEKVMRVVCTLGKCNVRDVVRALGSHHVAYTTVMTTMVRLFQKGLLQRETDAKAYVYLSAMSWPQLETQLAQDLIRAFLACRNQRPAILAAALVDAVETYGSELLAEVEDQIRLRRVKVAYAHWDELGSRTSIHSGAEMPLGMA